MKTRTGVAVLVAVPLALGLAACGSSSTTTASVAAVASTTTSSSTTTTTPPATKKKSAPAKAKKKKSPSHAQTTTTTTTSPTTTTSTTTTTTHRTTTTHQTTTTTAAIASLPSPYVSKTSGQLKVEFRGQDHSPKIKVKWQYFVEATNASGQPLAGKVLTEFLFSGTVEGKEVPPYHTLTGGKLANKVTFPAESLGVPLTVQIIVTTKDGSVTLDWPVKPVK